MKKFLALLLTVVMTMTALGGIALAESDRLTFVRSETTVFEGGTLATQLDRGGDAVNGTITYKSSSEKNATVDQNGVVTGISKGRTTITASLKTDKRSYRATITLTIARKVASVALDTEKLSVYAAGDPAITPLLAAETTLPTLVLSMGKTTTLSVDVEPRDANDRKLVLTSSDEAVMTVRNSALTPKAIGECDLTIASKQNPEITAVYHVLVVQPITRLTLSAPATEVYVGGQVALATAYTPDDATVKEVTWESLNEKVATVDQNGNVTGIAKGSANIRATAADGSRKTATIGIRVLQQPTQITLKENSAVINVGSYKTLQATVLPANTNDKSVLWSSSDERVATVNRSGRVTPVAPGTCTITCASENFPDVSVSATIEVHQLVTRVAFTEKEVTFNVNTDCTVYWETAPSNATNPAVALTSSNTKIATVNDQGVIHGVKRGTCTVTATATDGSGKRARITVNVLQPVEGVHMSNDTIRVGVDETETARAVLEPSDASNTHMSWVSEDTSIATVKGTRNHASVTGHRWGTTTITGTTEDGGFTTTCTVKVGNYDKAVEITDLYLNGDEIKIVARNASNMNITKFFFEIECYDMEDQPLACNVDGRNIFGGEYNHTLYEGESTAHGRFTFTDFAQPYQIGRVVMRITGYRTDEGYSRTIKNPIDVDYKTAGWQHVDPYDGGDTDITVTK